MIPPRSPEEMLDAMLRAIPGGWIVKPAVKLAKHLRDDDNDDDGEKVINTYTIPPYVN